MSDARERTAIRRSDSSAAVVREIEIINKKGLHARASAKFVQTRRTIRRRSITVHPRS